MRNVKLKEPLYQCSVSRRVSDETDCVGLYPAEEHPPVLQTRLSFGICTILLSPILYSMYCNNRGLGGNIILRTSVDNGGVGAYTKGVCAKNRIDVRTQARKQNHIVYRLSSAPVV